MSVQSARAFADRINLKEVLIAPHYSGLVADLTQLAEADHGLEDAAAEVARREMVSVYGYGRTPDAERKPFAYADGVAIIPVHGTLINRFSSSWSYVTGYNFVRSQLQAAIDDDDVKLIVFDVNSYGGEAAGCFELCEDIYLARSVKPSIALIDSNSYSAGYAVASSATKVYLTPSGGVGSIGVYVMHVNMSKALKDFGYEVTFIKSGEHKTDGNPYEALPDSVKANIQSNVDQSRTVFATLVARNRGITVEAVMGTEAGIFRADAALTLGLIDAVVPPSQVIEAYFAEVELSGSDDDPTKENVMAVPETKPDAASAAVLEIPAAAAAATLTPEQAAAAAVTAERARASGIINCEEAAGKSSLANHLALSTNMSVDDAKATLKASAPEKATVAATSPLDAAMNATGSPKVGADDGPNGTEQAGGNAVQRILASQSQATGVKPK